MLATLDYRIAAKPAARPNDTARTNRILGMQCLILTPDATVARTLSRELAGTGIEVREGASPEAALEAMRHERFDLVVVDQDAVEGVAGLLCEMRGTAANQKVITVAVMGTSPSGQHLPTGASLTLQKPLSPRALTHALNALMGTLLQERRRSFRLPVEIPALLRVDRGPATQVTVINISEEGMAIQCPQQLTSGEFVSASFALPHSKLQVELDGQIVWSDRNGRAGIHVRNVQPAVKRAFGEWLRDRFEALIDDLKREVSAA